MPTNTQQDQGQPKAPWKSRTLWLNGLAVAIYLISNHSGLLHIPPDVAVAILGVLNAIMRFLTGQPLELSLKGGGKVTIGPV